ncbi:hypothetical protein COU61_02375 [Candidatus Pacearchaeota archaeon CG10_big_fil_rev_8_21_14_0_10_35_13]|nr:MAG: hypothetical protein COU61_02375 [Candidatus Pacearchaeota archaeon CG10_big_fil_rev_8_21_14_0_10_35_13]
MRIKLKKGKQKDLIIKSKSGKPWKELAKRVGLNEHYLSDELRNEKHLISEEVYIKLCKILGSNYDKFILRKLDNNWGRSKGGNNSSWDNTKPLIKPKESVKLAELFGSILGDGHVQERKKGRKGVCYNVMIIGGLGYDDDYIKNYLPKLFKELFGENAGIQESEKYGWVRSVVYGKNIVKFLRNKGIKPGNKKVNNQGIPNWIKKNRNFLRACIRGLIDTDGSIHYISRKNKNLRISFTSHIQKLLADVREGLIKTGITPSKIISNRQIFISKKELINKFLKEVGFHNEKHLNRLNSLRTSAPIV